MLIFIVFHFKAPADSMHVGESHLWPNCFVVIIVCCMSAIFFGYVYWNVQLCFFSLWLLCSRNAPASVAQLAEAQCAPTGTVCRRGRVQSPDRPVDFVFGFQGRML